MEDDLSDTVHLNRVMTALEAESNVAAISRHRAGSGEDPDGEVGGAEPGVQATR